MKRTAKSAKLVLLDNDDPILAETQAIQGRIRQRAFELSQKRPPDVHKLYDWISAESEVVSVPPVELVERNGVFDVMFAVAGVNPDDVNVMVTPGKIVLKSQFTHQHDPDNGTIHLCDFKSMTIFRAVTMPYPIDVTSVKADFEEGMLHVSAVKEGASEARKSASAKESASAVKEGASPVKESASAVKEGASPVKEGASAVKEGASAVKEGASAVKEGASAAKEGASAAKEGASPAKEGANAARESASAAKEGASAVKEGAGEEVRKRPTTARKTGVRKSRPKQP